MIFSYNFGKVELMCSIEMDSIERYDRATNREYEEFFFTLESAEHKGQDISHLLSEEVQEEIIQAFKDQQDLI